MTARWPRRLLATVLALVAIVGAGCDALRAQTSDIFLTREATVFLDPPPSETGETILTIENNDDVEHQPLIIRLDDGVEVDDLELTEDGNLEVGRPIDLEYRGDGYQVVEKLETMRPYFGQAQRITTVVHVYLDAGTYAIVDNLAGGIPAGTWAMFEVGA